MFVVKRLTIDFIGLMMVTEGEPKPHRRRNEGDYGAPVARFGVWVGPFQIQREPLSPIQSSKGNESEESAVPLLCNRTTKYIYYAGKNQHTSVLWNRFPPQSRIVLPFENPPDIFGAINSFIHEVPNAINQNDIHSNRCHFT